MGDSRKLLLEGALIGASLGTPFAGLKEGHIQQLLGGRAEGYLADGRIYPARPEKNRLPGLHGIAGQRLLASLAMGLPDDLGRDPVALAASTLMDLAGGQEGEGTGAMRQPGRPLVRAIRRWREEFPWTASDHFANEEKSAGMSPLLAAFAPILVKSAVPDLQAGHLARLTHQHPYPVAGAIAVSSLANHLLEMSGRGKKTDGVQIAESLVEVVRTHETEYTAENEREWREHGWAPPQVPLWKVLSTLPSLIREANDDLAVRTIVNTAKECHPDQGVSHVQHGFVPAGLTWALYRALGPLAPVHALEDIMNRGGEAETIAGIVGGAMALRYGEECLSPEWQEGCLAVHLAGDFIGGNLQDTLAKWLTLEAKWTREEEALQAPLRETIEARERAASEKEKQRHRKIREEKADVGLPDQEQALFAPPPHLWLEPGDEEHPAIKRKLKAARGKKKIGWKEERRKNQREGPEESFEDT